MSVPKGTDRNWRISSYSGGNQQCVEVAVDESAVGVRDSKARMSGELAVLPASWLALLEQIR